MKLTYTPVERMSPGGTPQEPSLIWRLWGHPESIHTDHFEGYDPFSTSYLIEPDQIPRTSTNLIKSGAHLILRWASPANPTLPDVELIGNLYQGLASATLVKQLGPAR